MKNLKSSIDIDKKSKMKITKTEGQISQPPSLEAIAQKTTNNEEHRKQVIHGLINKIAEVDNRTFDEIIKQKGQAPSEYAKK